MNTIHIAASREYDVLIGHGLLDELGVLVAGAVDAKTAAIVSDDSVFALYGKRAAAALERAGLRVVSFAFPHGESSKNLTVYGQVLNFLCENRVSRTDVVVALGGGVVGDLAGFAAATILRGVDFVQIPTTLLAQVDSSVGGKVAVDLKAGKNLAGAFWQPRLVLMDPSVLGTLEGHAFSDGMAEVIKYGCIFDADFYSFLEQRPSRDQVMAEIEHVLYTCCDLKRRVVLEDERDTGARMLLNFGHTLGHAYELAGRYETWTHGQAVAAGMVKAARLGTALGVTPEGTAERIGVLLGCFGLPLEIPCTAEEYAAAVGLDKKGAGRDISVILLEEIGRAAARKMPKAELLALL